MSKLTGAALLERLAGVVAARLPRTDAPASHARAEFFFETGGIDSVQYGRIADIRLTWAAQDERSKGRFLHGFLYLPDLDLYLRQTNGGPEAAGRVFMLLKDWSARFPLGHETATMAYHDETTAQRVIHLLAILPQLQSIPSGDREFIHRLLDKTADLLASEAFHAGHNNHGMFQDIALLTYAALAHWGDQTIRQRYVEVADQRLMTYFRDSFTSEGVHIENAPNYHVLVARYLKEHRDLVAAVGGDHADELDILLRGATEYATHAVMPTGSFPLISDTQPTHLPSVARDVFDDPGFLYAATGGTQGAPPRSRVLTLPNSGYAIYRSAWGDPDAAFVLFQAAYNSGYHKHSDDNSLWIRHAGKDLLCEAGPNGYEYQNPLTQYAYSQFAHNTVIAGGRSTRRHDGNLDGVTMVAHESGPEGFTVTGHNARLSGAVHERTVSVHDAFDQDLVVSVEDRLRSDQVRRFQILWNVGEGLDVRPRAQGFDLALGTRRLLSLEFVADVPVRMSTHTGETDPEHLGWRFPRFGVAQPSPVVCLTFSAQNAQVSTVIRLCDEEIVGDVSSAQMGPVRVEVLNEVNGTVLEAVMDVDGAVQYAFKLYQGKEIVAQVPYSPSPRARWSELGAGRYRVRGYARKAAGAPVLAHTSSSVYVR